jgi:hypothetical protein
MEALADEAHALSERIGEDHDLTVLLAWTEENAPDTVEALTGRGSAAAPSCGGVRDRRTALRRPAGRVHAAARALVGRVGG